MFRNEGFKYITFILMLFIQKTWPTFVNIHITACCIKVLSLLSKHPGRIRFWFRYFEVYNVEKDFVITQKLYCVYTGHFIFLKINI